MKTIYKISITTVLSLILTSFALAGPGGPGHRRGMGPEMLKLLNLSPEQQNELNKLKAETGSGMGKLREEKKKLREKMQAAFLTEGDDNEKELRDLHKEKLALKMKMATARFEKMLAVRRVLDSEQRKTFHKLMREKRQKRRNKRHKRNDYDG